MSSKQPKPVDEVEEKTPSWRDDLTIDEQQTIDRAYAMREFWQGVQNNDPLILIAKMADLLDEKDG